MAIEWKPISRVYKWESDWIETPNGRRYRSIIEASEMEDVYRVDIQEGLEGQRRRLAVGLTFDEAKTAAEAWLLNQQGAT